MQDRSHRTFAGLLRSAVEEPGTLSSAYHAFHSYSLGNQLLAMFQCQARGLKPGPMATFPRWKELGRHVRKGQKALTLCMPLTLKRRAEPDADAADSADDSDAPIFVRFVYRARWFVLAQTEGAELPEPSETLQTPTIIARQSDRPHVAAPPPEVVDDVWVQPRHPATEEDDSEPTLH